MQKSLQGLLQSILFEILKECLDLAPKLCPQRFGASVQEPWTLRELSGALDVILNSHVPNVRFSFFIDGLDEYDGDTFDVIACLDKLSRSDQVRICLASRPWNAFEDRFGSPPGHKLYLEHLTHADIKQYVYSNLEKQINLSNSWLRNSDAAELTRSIVERSSGVFLWVTLVVSSLRRGLSNGDTFSMLKKRLDTFPRELKQFFDLILAGIEDVYKEQFACLVKVQLLETKITKDLFTYSFLMEDDLDFCFGLPLREIDGREMTARLSRARKALEARFKGLIGAASKDNRVDFLHRTERL
ncbi:hypothetical protein K490DRAFT_69096 [Saccharata proteae CBS 121410]|uniref:NACHT domain-containing protein n=1 Tax=Saccharata proteae CBS 121410 TaxID=1314787 RepID=A0A9P4LWJ2_9PEZI|nr:hypothetical protein K490DRAFT_69096 [Saccharata proteae CBS 121410]